VVGKTITNKSANVCSIDKGTFRDAGLNMDIHGLHVAFFAVSLRNSKRKNISL